MNTKYLEYLKSKEWQDKRNEVFELKGRQCQKCQSTTNLRIHHGTYANIYNEKLEELFVLCENCHDEYHRRFPIASLPRMNRFLFGKKKIYRSWKYTPYVRKTPRKGAIVFQKI